MIYKANLNNDRKEVKVKTVLPDRDQVITDFKDPGKLTVIQTPKKKRRVSKKMIFFLFLIFAAVFGGLFLYDRIQSYSSRVEIYDSQGNKINVCDNILNPQCWTDAFKPQLKQSDGFTTALVLGVDTRPGTHALMNTDTIMAITFNHQTQEIMMVSIPRDFWSTTYNSKINAVYALTYKKGISQQNDEYYYLKQEISNIIGKPIQYTVLVHFEGVINLVNDLGGIEVCPSDTFTAKYPNDNAKKTDKNQWLFYDFTKGCQEVDGTKALVYSRFRYLAKGPGYLASDFSRARRQQEVINDMKNKALSDNVPLEQKAETYWAMFQSLNQMIEVNVNFEDVLAALSYVNTFDRVPVSVVLDPNFQGLNKFIYTDSNAAQGYNIKPKDKTYKAIRDEIASIWQYSAFYKESPKVVVRNVTGAKTLPKDNLALQVQSQTKYLAGFDVINDKLNDKITGIHLFDFTGGKKPDSLAKIQKLLGVSIVETLPEQYGIQRSNKNEDFLIIVGPSAVTSGPATPIPSN